ncbi:metal-dependent transcriptional regulator [Lacrimispora algidixylanolytica]|uniref:DtxR family transcriptional regulator n=1 Tax=Lacrimispora algidixylanolytica TaxID=94868 RepID=A0A419T136_9FIRM|nr:metal-dependent transcriptional regulator [Lacrimispora algidixylanolytica]RKD31138.1 DtxR family transcriptional regulator [Lacrimispora algidixylanolytica]
MKHNKCHHLEKKLSPSREEYLKAIYKLSERTQLVRSIDIAVYLGVSKPSVHSAVTTLQKEGLVIKPLGGEIQLTEEGRKQGEIITTKFQVISQFLITCCDVNELIASADACKIEHIISNDAILALKKYLGLVQGDAL